MGRQEAQPIRPAFIDNTHPGERPRARVEKPAVRTIEQLEVGQVFFVDPKSVMLYADVGEPDKSWVVLCTAFPIPAEQHGEGQYAIYKIVDMEPNGDVVDEYVVDARGASPSQHEPDSQEYFDDRNGRKPILPLTMAWTPNVGSAQYVIEGDEKGRDALQYLIEQVDAHRASVPESEPKRSDIMQKLGLAAGRLLEIGLPLFKSLIADEIISHEITGAIVQKIKHG